VTTKAQLHDLIDTLPDDGEKLEAVREWIAERLAAWHAAGRIAEERGWDVEERHLKSGSIIRNRRPAADVPDEEWVDEDSTAALASLSVPVFRRDWDSEADSIYDDES
jgi:hypothetical protein